MECFIITGCTRGLGLAIHDILVSHFAEQNRCIFLGRNLSRLDINSNCVYLDIDLEKKYDPELLKELLPSGISRLTIISNAGMVTPIEKVCNIPLDTFTTSVNVNFLTPAGIISSMASWSCMNQIPLRVLNVSSGAANRAIKGWSTYCATKAGFKMFLDVLAVEQSEVEVIHFDPGVMDTSMQEEIRKCSSDRMPDVDAFIDFKENNKLNTPEDVAMNLLSELGLKL